MQYPPPPSRRARPALRRRRAGAVLAVVVLLAAFVTVLLSRLHPQLESGQPEFFAHSPYGPQPARNAEWTGNPNGRLDADQLHKLATNVSIAVLPKFADDFSIQGHFADARRLMSTARAEHRNLRVFEYFNVSYWYNVNETGWTGYADSFQPSWLLTDTAGSPIPFYGAGNAGPLSNLGDKQPVGYMLDLRNPELRAWIVDTVGSWMRQAPYAGIAFDSAVPLVGTLPPTRGIRPRVSAVAKQLCAGQPDTCTALDDWNAGLRSLLAATTARLSTRHDTVLYNGIAPALRTGPTRNIALLDVAGVTSNELFCLGENDGHVELTSLADDVALMRSIAADGKQVLEMTTYGDSDEARDHGGYCTAGFLMGWQPGSSFQVFHSSYHDDLDDSYPRVPEQSLELGLPTAPARSRGDAMTRTFRNGFVAVNGGDAPAKITVPVTGTSFADGVPGDPYRAGTEVELPGRGSLFLLTGRYLHG